jgi:hypothetical protein
METTVIITAGAPASPSGRADSPPATGPTEPEELASRRLDPAVLDTLRTSWTYCNAAGERLGSSSIWLIGAVSSVLAALSATTIFASLESDRSSTAKSIVAVFVASSAILTGLQTYVVRHRDEVTSRRDLLHHLHCEIEDALHKWQQGTDFEPDFGKKVRERLEAIDTAPIRAHGRNWLRAQQSTKDKMKADFGLE